VADRKSGRFWAACSSLDHFALFFTALCVVAMIGTILISDGYLRRFDLMRGEYYALLLLTTADVRAGDGHRSMTVFHGLELMSLSLYVTNRFPAPRFLANEAAMKYFLTRRVRHRLLPLRHGSSSTAVRDH
jgi:NADH-quinone oxidoreductase subunit N